MFVGGMGCNDSGDETAATGGTGGTGGTGAAGGSGGAAGTEAPVITMVRWNWEDDCMVGMSRAVTVAVSATDDDTDQASLIYTGSISDCTPTEFGGNVAELSILDCTTDHTGLRSGSVTVEDREQNIDTVGFTFDPCESGDVCEGGDLCE
jgi:hypothetical protein